LLALNDFIDADPSRIGTRNINMLYLNLVSMQKTKEKQENLKKKISKKFNQKL